jgi:hypothetical protein
MAIIPDSQQRSLAGEYYVAFILSRLGYDVCFTMGHAKVFDMVAIAPSGESLNVQVKCTYNYGDWLVRREFNSSANSIVALVRLGNNSEEKPELFFLPGEKANTLITHKYKTHSPRISRTDVRDVYTDHDFELVRQLLEKDLNN